IIGRAPQGEGRGASELQRRLFLAASLISNIGMLVLFKYSMFIEHNVNGLITCAGGTPLTLVSVVLPVGISFYTFESISYNLDIYHGLAKPAIVWVSELTTKPRTLWGAARLELRALGAFACYITQFPHLVAGPIIRYQDLERQLHFRTHTLNKCAQGIF